MQTGQLKPLFHISTDFVNRIGWCLISAFTLPVATLTIRIFHKLSAVKECQYCQLYFSSAIGNELYP